MTGEQAAKYVAEDRRVLAVLREHGPQFIMQLWARIALPEVEALAKNGSGSITPYEEVSSAFLRLWTRKAVDLTNDLHIALAEDAQTPS